MSVNEIAIRQAGLYDVPFICRVEAESFDTPRSAEAVTKDITEGRDDIYIAVAEQADDKIGYADMRMVAGEAQIYNIAISREFRAKGYGELLLEHLIEAARNRGCRVITLEVSSSNEAGISLYEKMGFYEVGRRKAYYDKKTDAILMNKDLVQVEIDISI